MYKYIRSDLVAENSNIEAIKGKNEYSETQYGDISVCRLNVESDESNNEYACEKGNYTTVYFPRDTIAISSQLSDIVAKELRTTISRHIRRGACVLVAGIGNKRISADALGPMSIDGVYVTRLADVMNNVAELEGVSICALECGVAGETGIESSETVKAMVREVGADIVIAVDALAARSAQRLMATVQISDVGISPGAGIGNRRSAINKETVGVPVVAVGIPTVVSASTIVAGALSDIGHTQLCEKAKASLEGAKDLFVTPKECDVLMRCASKMLSDAINKALLEYDVEQMNKIK